MKQEPPKDNSWFITYTGRQFFVLNPNPEDIVIEDIAHSLANICRFGGHSKKFYSVAQHSLFVSRCCPKGVAFEALMHDATEAYCGDMIRPLKLQLPQFKVIEHNIWLAIADKFGLPKIMTPIIKHYDDVALMTERRDLIHGAGPRWSLTSTHSTDHNEIIPQEPDEAEALFLSEFKHLYKP